MEILERMVDGNNQRKTKSHLDRQLQDMDGEKELCRSGQKGRSGNPRQMTFREKMAPRIDNDGRY